MPCSGQLHGMNMAKIIVWKIRIVLLLLGSNKTAWGPSQEETQEVLREALLSSIKAVGSWPKPETSAVGALGWGCSRPAGRLEEAGGRGRLWAEMATGAGVLGSPWETLEGNFETGTYGFIKSADSFTCFRPCASNSPWDIVMLGSCLLGEWIGWVNGGNGYHSNDFLQSMWQLSICISNHVNSAWHINARSVVAINVTSYCHSEFQIQVQIMMIATNVRCIILCKLWF